MRLRGEPLKRSELEFSTLLEVCRSGRIDGARLRHIAGVETLARARCCGTCGTLASLRPHAAGPASYYEP